MVTLTSRPGISGNVNQMHAHQTRSWQLQSEIRYHRSFLFRAHPSLALSPRNLAKDKISEVRTANFPQIMKGPSSKAEALFFLVSNITNHVVPCYYGMHDASMACKVPGRTQLDIQYLETRSKPFVCRAMSPAQRSRSQPINAGMLHVLTPNHQELFIVQPCSHRKQPRAFQSEAFSGVFVSAGGDVRASTRPSLP